ncbi:cytochrome c [Paracoccus sp. MC1862]|uniref:c-type cytochrome n=1 Tax=Paracoccus sp. MC1862 TaxID=2760307 RepID=UPI00160044DD|nr:cytochrome c [Paracoccus sp. MC1862]MBB1498618.1 cytochrome c [Paracoccus sp. MC1862]QQO46131.1 cytochrome c [Paracoccus sp. MC1862]
MAITRSFAPRPAWGWWLCVIVAGLAVAATWFFSRSPDLQRGAALYAAHCASCHGTGLEGQPDWKIPDAEGVLPAPPHDETGHTWHHDDAMLADYIRRGGQAVLDDMGVPMTSGMPAFGDVLSKDDIAAILAFIKSRWPERMRAIQAGRNADRGLTDALSRPGREEGPLP